MSLDQQLRDHYRTTDEADVAAGPDLGSVLRHGRRRRRTRITGVAAGAVAVVAAGAVVAATLTGGGTDTATDPNRGPDAAAAPGDYVPGTEVDDTMRQVVAEHLPVLGDPTDVYPSDWNHNGPMPDADFAAATDWQAAYQVDEDERLLVVMGYPKPAEPTGCPDCRSTTVPEGTLMTQVSWREDAGEWVFFTGLVRDDGFSVSVIDYVVSPEVADARTQRTVSNTEATDLARDPRLRFPRPAGR